VPAEVLAEGKRDPEVEALVGAVSTAFLNASSASGQGLWGPLVRSVWFRGTESWSDRVRFLHEWVLMPRPPDWEWVSLPTWAGPAYYLVRPLRLSLKHGWALLGFRAAGQSAARSAVRRRSHGGAGSAHPMR
jgi:hypothetical protein